MIIVLDKGNDKYIKNLINNCILENIYLYLATFFTF